MLSTEKKSIVVTMEADLTLRGIGGRTKLGVGGVLDLLVLAFSKELEPFITAEDIRDCRELHSLHAPVHGEKVVELSAWAADYLDGVSRLTDVPVLELVSLIINRGGKRALDSYAPFQPQSWSGFGAQLLAVGERRRARLKADTDKSPRKAGKVGG